MTDLVYHPLSSQTVHTLRHGGTDAYGRPPEKIISDGDGTPCRHCLHDVPKGAEMLVLAHCPFPEPQPYAETGPIFLCADDCAPWQSDGIPPILTTSAAYLLKGYHPDHRIFYGTGRITPADDIEPYARALLSRPGVAFVDVRSAVNNCFQVRITLGE